MIYRGVELDQNGKALKCPHCKNEEVDGKYCKVCNTYLFNICTGFDPSEERETHNIRWAKHDRGCKGLLDGNARFCHECGSTSSFFVGGLLTYWNEEPNNNQQPITLNDAANFTEEELPF